MQSIVLGHSAPLRDYDGLSVSRIRRQLDFLLERELRELREYERHHKRRKTVLRMIDGRLRSRRDH